MKSLYLGNLDFEATDHDVEAAFHSAGFHPRRVRIIYSPESGRSRGFGFAEFADPGECARASDALQGVIINGRKLLIREAKEKSAERAAVARA